VSAFVIFEVFVRPYLGGLSGGDGSRRRARARLSAGVKKASDRVQFLPARLDERAGTADLLAWRGSADLFTLAGANAFAVVPPGEAPGAGAECEFLVLDGR
jgi:molybdopterin biosynthesis enzyme